MMTDWEELKQNDPRLAERLARRQKQGDTMTDQNGNTNGTPPQPPLPEAPASINAKVIDPNGFDVMLTVRDHSMRELFKKWKLFSDQLIKQGFRPTNAPRPAAPPQAPPEPTPAEVEARANPERVAASQPQQPQAQAGPPVAGGQSFAAEKLTASMNEGKTYWKVKGGRFLKFGVTIWPETLQAAQQAGLILSGDGELNPALAYDLSGWVAHYSLTDEGKPQKVTMLAWAA